MILVGESYALVLAAAFRLINVTPMAALFGEPPLSNGYGMHQMRSQFASLNNQRVNAIKNALGLMSDEPIDFTYLFSRPEYPILLMFGLKRECDEITPFHSVIEQGELDSLPEHKNLLPCGVKEHGHRVLQSSAIASALIFKGLMMARDLDEGFRSSFSYKDIQWTLHQG